MADYLLLYSGGSMPETEEQQAAVMQAWTDWFTSLGAAVAIGLATERPPVALVLRSPFTSLARKDNPSSKLVACKPPRRRMQPGTVPPSNSDSTHKPGSRHDVLFGEAVVLIRRRRSDSLD